MVAHAHHDLSSLVDQGVGGAEAHDCAEAVAESVGVALPLSRVLAVGVVERERTEVMVVVCVGVGESVGSSVPAADWVRLVEAEAERVAPCEAVALVLGEALGEAPVLGTGGALGVD